MAGSKRLTCSDGGDAACSDGGRAEKRRKHQEKPTCQQLQRCREFLGFLALDPAYLDAKHDRCYCPTCAAAANIPDLLEEDKAHGTPYEIPMGYCGFGLDLPARARAEKVFDEWVVSFHGCPREVIPSILRQGDLLMPGDTLLDGTKLQNRLTRGGRERIGLYTSPSIKYSELDIYTKPGEWNGHKVRVVIQCRQRPSSFRTEGETIRWQRRFGNAGISKHFTNQEIERFTHARGSIIPYRVLVSMDVITREEEEERRKHQEEERKELEQKLESVNEQIEKAEKLARQAEAAAANALRTAQEARRVWQDANPALRVEFALKVETLCARGRHLEKQQENHEDEQEAEQDSGVKALVAEMKQNLNSAEAQQKGCEAIHHLADTESNRALVAAAGGIEVVIAAMRTHGASEGVQEQGCAAVCNLAKDDNSCVKIGEEGGVEAVILAMRTHGTSAGVQEQGCWALANLSKHNCAKIVAGGGVEAVIAALRTHGASAKVQEQGCAALQNLAFKNDRNRVKIGEKGGVEAVILGMRTHGASAKVQEQGCAALWNLALNETNRVKIGEKGGVEAVISGMRTHVATAGVQEQGCWVLLNLAAKNKDKIVAAGGIEVVTVAKQQHTSSRKVQSQGRDLLNVLKASKQ